MRNLGVLRLGLVAGLVSSLMGCASSLPETPMVPDQDFEEQSVARAGLAEDPPSAFTLMPGDVLRLRTVSVDPLDMPDVVVDSRGVIDAPMVGEIAVGGMSTARAAQEIESALHAYDRFAKVSITVTDAGGHTATVVGAVEHPGSIPLHGDTRLAQILAMAGGPKIDATGGEIAELADLDAATIVRDGQALPVSLGQALRGESAHNVRVRAGDVIFVPAAVGRMITVLGEVGRPRTVPFHTGMRLSALLANAGGLADGADSADVRVIRGSLAHPKVYRTDFGALVKGETHDVQLAPGDIVYVGKHWFWSMTDVMNRLMPGLAMASLATSFAK